MKQFEFDSIKRQIMEASKIPFAIYQLIDEKVVTILVSDGMCEILGMSREDSISLMNHDLYRDTHPDDIARVSEACYKFAKGEGELNIVYRIKDNKIGKYVMVHATGRAITPKKNLRLGLVWYSIEEFEKKGGDESEVKLKSNLIGLLHTESLIRENYYDGLTGLPNMTHFLQLADKAIPKMRKEKENPVMIFFDLTGMKLFNRKYGLAEGDRLLRAVAEILKDYFGYENCGRLSRDHFAVYTSGKGVEKKLYDIFSEVENINKSKSIPVRVGIYEDKFENVSASVACDRANLAADSEKNTYSSKFVYYDESIRDLALTKEYVLTNFEKAIKNNWIRPFYQQIVRTVTGQVCDEEALARWIDPERGLIPPDQFVPVLEDARLIHLLDLHMVDCVLKDIKRRKSAGIDIVPVSINISRYDLELCNIIDEICKRVDKAGVSRNFITLEITESVSGVDPELIKDRVNRFHKEGFKVWMDDFGSGYSSLTVLQNFDFDLIKFDMRFMREFNSSEKNPIILTALMQMATKLGIDTIAEGVETEEQIKFLKEIGCNKLQGYYFNRPNPTDVVIENFRQGTGIAYENKPESGYFEIISKASLTEPTINSLEYGEAVNEYLNALPMGVLEYSDDEFYVLRYNKTYEEFLIKAEFIPRDALQGNAVHVMLRRNPDPNFVKAAKKTVKSKQWVAVKDSVENGMSMRAYVRWLARNPVNGAEAVLIVILAATTDDAQ
jgi:diguanylate cyclase (GGDEF)-like protein